MSVAIDLSGKRLLVVGGSTGIGRSLAVSAAIGITAIAADIRDPDRCARLVTEAAVTSSRHVDRRERSAGVA